MESGQWKLKEKVNKNARRKIRNSMEGKGQRKEKIWGEDEENKRNRWVVKYLSVKWWKYREEKKKRNDEWKRNSGVE